MTIQTIPSFPPKVGEYSYHDSRLSDNDRLLRQPYALVQVVGLGQCGCHYSLPVERAPERYITCHGIIDSIDSLQNMQQDAYHYFTS